MGIFVNTLGDIVSTQPGYAGVKLISYDDETQSREHAERIAQRLRDVLGITDTVWCVTYCTNRVSPVFDSQTDARKWLRDNTAPVRLSDFKVVERQGNMLDVAYTSSPA